MIGKKFIKVYGQFFTGSFRTQRPTVKVVMLTLLWLADENGVVEATPSTIAFMSGVKEDACLQALSELEKPDIESSSPDEEGRRILKIGPNKILVVNYQKYLRMRTAETGSSDSRREYMREYMKSRRNAERNAEVNSQVQKVNSKPNVNVNPTEKSKEEKIIDSPQSPPRGANRRKRIKALDRGKPEFADKWLAVENAYPKPSNGRSLRKAEARVVFDALLDAGEDYEAILSGVNRYHAHIASTNGWEYVRAMIVFFNQRGWEEGWHVSADNPEVVKRAREQEQEAKRAQHDRLRSLEAEYSEWVIQHCVKLFDEGALGEKADELFDEWIFALKQRRSKISANAAAIVDKSLSSDGRNGYVAEFVKGSFPALIPSFEAWCDGR